MSGGGVRVSLSASTKTMIQSLQEITKSHSEEEIYAMLKECSMDPNEAAQRLLIQDPFHEVKSKREKRKENQNNRESAESSRRVPASQGRGTIRGGRPHFNARPAHDATGSKNYARDNGKKQVAEKSADPSLPLSRESKNKVSTPASSSLTLLANGPAGVHSGSKPIVHGSNLPAGTGVELPKEGPSAVEINKLGVSLSSVDTNKNQSIAFGAGDKLSQLISDSTVSSVSLTPGFSSAVCFSSSDPVLIPSNDTRVPGAVGAIKREGASLRAGNDLHVTENKSMSKSHGAGKSHTESSQPLCPSAHSSTSVSRPSSNYNNRSQQIGGSQKAGSNKEWKPKPTNPNAGQGSGATYAPEVPVSSVEAVIVSQALSDTLDSAETTSKLQRKLEDLHLPRQQHVIIPNHIQVPESERTKLSFGSFDATFGITSSYVSAPESEKSSTNLSELSQDVEETLEEQTGSNQNALSATKDGDYPHRSHSPSRAHENLSGEGDVSTYAGQGYSESKQEASLVAEGHQYPVVHSSPNYNFGFVPPVLGSQLAQFESSDSQARDVSRLPGFVVPQPLDPANYYAQFYRHGDGDGRVSPFPPPGIASKYNGNVTVVPPPTSQSPQEGGNTAGPTTQAGGPMQSSVPVTQQAVPVFRPPGGMHISHYPPNYLPYGYYSFPLFVPPPGAIHQLYSNGAFPQQPPASSVYPAQQAAAATGVKYSLPQYKPGTNTGNPTHIGIPTGYGPYGASSANYNNPSSAASAGNSTSEDLNAGQFKDSSVYLTGQQSEGSTVWIGAPGRDMSSLPASSFYNIPPQGQHVTYAPAQGGHGTFPGIYHHPAQPVTAAAVHSHPHPLMQQSQGMAGNVDMVGPGGNVYQQNQHGQINWPSNY